MAVRQRWALRRVPALRVLRRDLDVAEPSAWVAMIAGLSGLALLLRWKAGSVELGPITGMSEAIVDLVASGRTLRDNGLVAIEDLFQSTARLIGHPLSLRLDDGRLRSVVERIGAAAATAAA